MFERFDGWAVKCAFAEPSGEKPIPWCAVGKNLKSGAVKTWTHLDSHVEPFYSTGDNSLIVTFRAADVGKCIRQLKMQMPAYCIDLDPLFKCHQNRFGAPLISSLVNALICINQPGIASIDTPEPRLIAQRGPLDNDELSILLDSCRRHIDAFCNLLPLLSSCMTLPHALIMGRYNLIAISAIQLAGIPLNHTLTKRLIASKTSIRRKLIATVDADFGVFSNDSLDFVRLHSFVTKHGFNWPRTVGNLPRLDVETFKAQALIHPQLIPLADLVRTLDSFKSLDLSIGGDGRNRVCLNPFASITGRNQPSSSKFIYGCPKWMRQLIVPPDGKAIITLDYKQQEVLIGAILSRDKNMINAALSDDYYLVTGIRSGLLPRDATEATHGRQRELIKRALLAIQYGCSVNGLAAILGNRVDAQRLHEEHRRLYPQFHLWCQRQIDRITLGSPLTTSFGWTIRKRRNTTSNDLNRNSFANWPIQSAGADMLRIAVMMLVDRDFLVIALNHDEIVIECDLSQASEVASHAEKLMREASRVILRTHECKVACHISGKMMPAPPSKWDMSSRILSLLSS